MTGPSRAQTSRGPELSTPRRTGVEQEFVVSRGESPVDFRTYARRGRLPGRRLDADDPHAHRQSDGGVITADGAEAEIATPPVLLGPGFTSTLHAAVSSLHGGLDGVLAGEGLSTRGVSTHLNVEVADAVSTGAAIRFVHRHAAAMMLLLDRVESPGLLVRPRRARLEIGGEYAVGGQLEAALVFAAAATLDAERPGFVPPRAHPRIEPARMRYGWYVDRRAFGPDLYRDGRRARIGRLTGQDLLEASWTRCRGRIEHVVSAAELQSVDDLVSGRSPLPCEHPEEPPRSADRARLPPAAAARMDLTFDRILGPVTVRPVTATWDHVVFAVVGSGEHRYVALPSATAELWLDRLCAGHLTQWCLNLLSAPLASLPVLASVDDVGPGRAFGSIAAGASLSLSERDPLTGRLDGGPPGDARRDKHHEGGQASSVPNRRPSLARTRSRWWPAAAAAAAAAAVVLAILSALALARGRDDDTATPAGPSPEVPSSPVPTSAPKVNEELARSLVGTYDVTTVVTKGNSSLPAGTTGQQVLRLKLDCSRNRCTVSTAGISGTLRGGVLRFEGNPTEPCPNQQGGTVKDHYVIRLTPRVVNGEVVRLVGTEFLESVDVSACQNVTQEPVTFSWVGVRR